MRKLITLAFIATGLTLSACNTVRGAANDVEVSISSETRPVAR